jgi:hypothetical protein
MPEVQSRVRVRVVNKRFPELTEVHFTKDGQTSINYSATISLGDEPYAFVGVRPE